MYIKTVCPLIKFIQNLYFFNCKWTVIILVYMVNISCSYALLCSYILQLQLRPVLAIISLSCVYSNNPTWSVSIVIFEVHLFIYLSVCPRLYNEYMDELSPLPSLLRSRKVTTFETGFNYHLSLILMLHDLQILIFIHDVLHS